MATFGNSTTPSSGYFYDDTGNSDYASKYLGFPGGVVTDIYVYCAGDLGNANIELGVWSTSALLAHGSVIFSVAGSRTIGGQTWQHSGGLSTYIAPQDLYMGFWTDGGVVWTYDSSTGDTHYTRGLASIGTGAQSSNTEGSGRLGAYIVYNPVSAPTISNVNPSVAPLGASVVITGTQFTYASSVTINGAAASFTVNSDTQITATVPSGATPGPGTIVVTNPAGSASIAFTVGQIWTNVGSGVVSIKNVWTNVGSGPVKVVGIWTNPGSGNKRIW